MSRLEGMSYLRMTMVNLIVNKVSGVRRRKRSSEDDIDPQTWCR